jgi:hypothetical protein
LGRPQSFIAKYEGGGRRLDVAEFIKIARIIGADPFKMLPLARGRFQSFPSLAPLPRGSRGWLAGGADPPA